MRLDLRSGEERPCGMSNHHFSCTDRTEDPCDSQACTDDACFCDDSTLKAVGACEQCMFNALIAGNLQMTDPREGNQVALTGASAQSNIAHGNT